MWYHWFVGIFQSYIKYYNMPKVLKVHNALFSSFIDYIALVLVLLIICIYTQGNWFLGVGLPLITFAYIMALCILCICRYIKIDKYLKVALNIIVCIAFILGTYALCEILLKSQMVIQIDKMQFPNFADWSVNNISSNVLSLIIITMFIIAVIFAILGLRNIIKKSSKIKD